MDIVQIDPANRSQRRDFLDLPFRLYQDNPLWVPPLAGAEQARMDKKKYPYYQHSQAAFFLAYRHDRAIGRLAVLDNRPYNDHNGDSAAFFYLFECENEVEAANRLFGIGSDWARQRGLTRMLGPKGFTALDGLGLLVKGFEWRPALGLPYNPSYYQSLIEAVGFEKMSDIVSGYLGTGIRFPERIHQLAERVRERSGLRIARFHSRNDLRHVLKALKTLYNRVLEGTSEGTPISYEEIQSLADQLVWFADPNLIKVVMKSDPSGKQGEQPVGFLLAYPDISAALQKTRGRLFPFGWISLLRESQRTDWVNINGAGMVPEYRGLGGTAILYSEIFKSLIENPRYHHIEVVQVGLENDAMQRELQNFGVDFYKIHRTYQKIL